MDMLAQIDKSFIEIFGEQSKGNLFQQGVTDCFDNKAPTSDNHEYLNGYAAEYEREQKVSNLGGE
jgi:hypothetical protein